MKRICIIRIEECGAPEGSRNDWFQKYAIYLFHQGLALEKVEEKARQANKKSQAPLSDSEFNQIIRGTYCRYKDQFQTSDSQHEQYDEEDLLNIVKDQLPLLDFPIDILPKPFVDCVESYVKSLQVDESAIVSSMFSVLSSAIGNSVSIEPKSDWQVKPFIWFIHLSPSGTGKTPAQNAILAPLRTLQHQESLKYEQELSDYKLELQLKKSEKQPFHLEEPKFLSLISSDTTIEALAVALKLNMRGVLIYRDEISGFIQGLNQYKKQGNDRQHILELYDCNFWKIDRKSGVTIIPNPGAGILGGIQNMVMPKVFSDDSFSDGLLARFLYVVSEVRSKKYNTMPTSKAAIALWYQLVNFAYDIPLNLNEDQSINPFAITFTDSAHRFLGNFYDHFNGMMPFLNDRQQTFIPKLITYTVKLAGILHIINCFFTKEPITTPIPKSTIVKSIRLTYFYAGQMVKCVELYDNDEDASKDSKQTTKVSEYERRLIRGLYHLNPQVRSGLLPLNVIREEINKGLPKNLQIKATQSKRIGQLLRKFNLETRPGTNGMTCLIWDDTAIEKLFSTMPDLNTKPGIDVDFLESESGIESQEKDPDNIDLSLSDITIIPSGESGQS